MTHNDTSWVPFYGDGPKTKKEYQNKGKQVQDLAEFLRTGKVINCEIARIELGIGSLPRRILDCKEFLGMNIPPAEWKPYPRKFDGKITHLAHYHLEMEEEPGKQVEMNLEGSKNE